MWNPIRPCHRRFSAHSESCERGRWLGTRDFLLDKRTVTFNSYNVCAHLLQRVTRKHLDLEATALIYDLTHLELELRTTTLLFHLHRCCNVANSVTCIAELCWATKLDSDCTEHQLPLCTFPLWQRVTAPWCTIQCSFENINLRRLKSSHLMCVKLVAEFLQRSIGVDTQETDVNQQNPHSFRTSFPLVFALFGLVFWRQTLFGYQRSIGVGLRGWLGDDFLETALPWWFGIETVTRCVVSPYRP